MARSAAQEVPVRVYRSDRQLVLAAPLAGLEAGDITVTIDGPKVTIHGNVRGPRQHNLDLIEAEWSIGPYHREVILPQPVDGTLTNATYGNGVLVLKMPTRTTDEPTDRTVFSLEAVGLARGERVGHTGHDILPVSSV